MRKLSASQYDKIKGFIKSEARDLECSQFEFEFEEGKKENVIEQLRKYQNADGGFGNGIEPDFWLPASSPMATWAAGQILFEIGADQNDPVIKSMISYLIETNHDETGMWDSVLAETNDFPHAPWWHWNKDVQAHWMFNPSVELAAFLIYWSSNQGKAAEVGWRTIEKAIDYLMNQSKMDRHQLNNFQQLIKLITPYENVFHSKLLSTMNDVSEKVVDLAENCVEKDISKWTEGYHALPLDFIDHPDHPLCKRLGSLVEENLTFYIEQITDEGVWDLSWNWGSDQENFKLAKRDWKGILAVNRLKQLRAFGCID